MAASDCSALGHRWLVTTLLLAAAAPPGMAPASVDRELLSTARDGSRSSVEAIETLYAEMTLSIGFEGKEPNSILTATYWREFGLVRIHEVSSHGVVTDYRGADGKANRLVERPVPNANAKVIGLLVGRDGQHQMETDAFDRALFTLPRIHMNGRDELPRYTIAEAIDRLGVEGCRWVTRGGRKVAEIRLRERIADPQLTIDYTINLDPSVNWLVRHIEFRADFDKFAGWRCEFDAAAFTEPAPSVFFPTATRAVYKLDGGEPLLHQATFTSVAVNQRPKLPFSKELILPKQGLLVTDKIEGTTYEVDSTGKRRGTPQILREVPPLARAPDPDPLAPAPSHRTKWYLIVAGACLLLLIASAIIRRRWRAVSGRGQVTAAKPIAGG